MQDTSVLLSLTPSQQSASNQLDAFWKIKRMGIQSVGGVHTRTNGLLVGPSGSGKTACVQDFARRNKLPVFAITANSWIVRGARNEASITTDHLASFVQKHKRGVIFIDELNKLRSSHGDNSWSMTVLNEIMTVIDADERLLHLGFEQESRTTLKSNYLIVGAGAWQEVWSECARKKATPGFGGQDASSVVDPAAFLAAVRAQDVIPEELLFRFNENLILIEPPDARHISERIVSIHEQAGQPRPDPATLECLAAEAVSSNRAMRWLEAYATRVVETASAEFQLPPPEYAPAPDKTSAKGRAFPLLYDSGVEIFRRLCFDAAFAARRAAARILYGGPAVGGGASNPHYKALHRFANLAIRFTEPNIDAFERRTTFDEIFKQKKPVFQALCHLAENESAFHAFQDVLSLDRLGFVLWRQALLLRKIMDVPSMVGIDKDKPDCRKDWFNNLT